MMARDRKLKKLRHLSGRDAAEVRQAERQAHLDRLDLMKGLKVLKKGLRGSVSQSFSSAPTAAAGDAGGCSLSSISSRDALSGPSTKGEDDDYEFVSYRDYFSNRDFQTSSSAPDSTVSQGSSTDRQTRLTVQLDARWQLVYVGNENSYACSHLVPSDVLSRELEISVPVQLCVQVLGADHPIYERSQPSVSVTFFTKSPSSMLSASQKDIHQHQTIDGVTDRPSPSRSSKLKREILSAVIHGQQQQNDRFVQIEKPTPNECCSRGIGESYI